MRFTIMIILSLVALNSQALDKDKQRTKNVEGYSHSTAIAKASKSVVSLYATKEVASLAQNVDAAIYGTAVKSSKENSLGSGVIVNSQGLILTNSHIVEDSQDIKVITKNGNAYIATVVDIDKGLDIAILRIINTDDKFTPITFTNSDNLLVGDVVFAIGNPFGIGQSASMGIISAIGRTFTNIENAEYLIQTDAAINPGNSGGALIDVDGNLVGLNSAIFSKTQTFSGVGFAVPSNALKFALDTLESSGLVQRAWLGAKGENLSATVKQALNLNDNSGVYLTNITANSPAAKAGFRAGDVLLELGTLKIKNLNSLSSALKTLGVDKRLFAKLNRNGRMIELELKLKAIERRQESDKFIIRGNNLLAGLVVEHLSPELNFMLSLPLEKTGVAIIEMPQKIANYNLHEGDVILQINKTKINETQDITNLLKQPQPYGLKLTILRSGRELKIFIK